MKRISILFLFCLVIISAYGHPETGASASHDAIRGGVGLGAVIAVVISWSRNKSIAWAILHGILSWIYVIYYVITDK